MVAGMRKLALGIGADGLRKEAEAVGHFADSAEPGDSAETAVNAEHAGDNLGQLRHRRLLVGRALALADVFVIGKDCLEGKR